MKIMVPKAVTAFVSNSLLPENDYPEYVAGTTYAKGAYCIMPTTHRIYVSLADGNVGNQPNISPAKWSDVGPTNSWAMFDAKVSTSSVATNSISVEFDSSKCNALAIFNMVGVTSVRVRQKYAGAVISDDTYDLTVKDSTCWTDYFFKTPIYKNQLYLPLILNFSATVLVTLSGPGTISCGWMGAGLEKYLGKSRFGMQVGIIDYSKKSTDTFGNTYLAVGAFAKKMTGDLYLLGWDITNAFNTLAVTRGTAVVWSGDNTDTNPMPGIIFLGFFKDFQITLQAAAWKTCSIEVEGLI